jgi:hypothetical protein
MHKILRIKLLLLTLCAGITAIAQIPKAPTRVEGEGQFNRMIIRGVNVINGTGSPMQGLAILLSRKTKSLKSR